MSKRNYVLSDEAGPSLAQLAERDRLYVLDTRSEIQRWLGDPPYHRSALFAKRTGR